MKKPKKTQEMGVEIDALFAQTETEKKKLGGFAEALAALDLDADFLTAYWKSHFVEQMHKAMVEQGCNQQDLAKKLQRSPQYVGRVLNETANFTIETMVKFALALNRQPYFGICKNDERAEIVPAVVRSGVYFKLPPASLIKPRLADFQKEPKTQTGFGGCNAGYLETGRVSFSSIELEVA